MPEQVPEDTDDRKNKRSRRRRLLAAIGRIRQRVGQICGVVDDADTLIKRAAEIAGEIRSVIESPDLRALLPADAQHVLEASADRLERVEESLEQIGDRSKVAADVCDHVTRALDIAEAALQGSAQWGRIADRATEWFSGLSLRTRVAAAVAGFVVVVLGAIGIANAFGGGSSEPEVFGVFMLPPALTMEVGDSLRIGVRVEAEGGIDVSDRVEISWSTDAPSVGQITADGNLEGLAPGVVGVTVEAAGISDFQEITVVARPLPDLTVQLNDPVFVSCAGGECTHTIVVRVQNTSRVDAGASTVRAVIDGLLSTRQGTDPIPAGRFLDVELTFPPGDSCYNPQCEVVAEVDWTGELDESDETNNVAEAIFGG